MKQKYTTVFAACLLVILFAGCVHDYPEMTADGEEGIDPTLVQVSTEVTLDLTLVPLEIITQKNARAAATNPGTTTDYRRRFIIEARRDGRAESRQVTVLENAGNAGNAATTGNDKITLPVSLKLHAVEYTLVVWTDYVKAGTTTDLYYDTANMECVSCLSPYTGNTDCRDCLYGTTQLDLRPYRDDWNARVQIHVDMVRPLAKYEIIATDAEDFLARAQKQRGAATTAATTAAAYTITISYGFYLPLGFNTLTGKPERSEMNVHFTAPLTVTADANGECVIASDYIFVNGDESYIPLNLEIHDAAGNGISRTTGLNVPYRREHLTSMRGRFLTTRYDTGVGINPDFDDEDIDIDLDKW